MNDDNTISNSEYAMVMRVITGEVPSSVDIQNMIGRADIDGDGSIDFPEFMANADFDIKDNGIANFITEWKVLAIMTFIDFAKELLFQCICNNFSCRRDQ